MMSITISSTDDFVNIKRWIPYKVLEKGLCVDSGILRGTWSLPMVSIVEWFLICISEGIRVNWGSSRDVAMLIVGVELASSSCSWSKELEDEGEYLEGRL